jgi:hypothetical protein
MVYSNFHMSMSLLMQRSIHETNTFQFVSFAKLSWRTRIDRMGNDKVVYPNLSCASCLSMFEIVTYGSGLPLGLPLADIWRMISLKIASSFSS